MYEDTTLEIAALYRGAEAKARSGQNGEAFRDLPPASLLASLRARGLESILLKKEEPAPLPRLSSRPLSMVNTNDIVRAANDMADDEGRVYVRHLKRRFRTLPEDRFHFLLDKAIDDGRLKLINDNSTLVVRRG